jgi:hypothetical protein
MRDHKNEKPLSYWDGMSWARQEYVLTGHTELFVFSERLPEVLGDTHPLVGLVRNALESGDQEELKVAEAALLALPEEVVHRMKHPWVGHPPPPGTRRKLIEEANPERVGESVGCYLRIDARKGYREEIHWEVDEDEHVLDRAIVYDLRVHPDWPVRVEIREGSDKKLVLALLEKITQRVERDWDKLTNPDRYLRVPEGRTPPRRRRRSQDPETDECPDDTNED